jgi:SAM-dependent methyltransferase
LKERKNKCIDFSEVTELPGKTVDNEHLKIIYRRYHFVRHFVEDKLVLEIGCGPGFGLGYLARKAKTVVGGDYTLDNLKIADQTYKTIDNIKLILLDGHRTPFKDRSFDVVISMATICYLNLEIFLTECGRILKDDGRLLFCIPNKNAPGFTPSRLSTKYYSSSELYSILDSYNFSGQLFGAFPVPEGRKKAFADLRAEIGRIFASLEFIPGTRQFKSFLRKLAGIESLSLKEEITEDDMKLVSDIPIEPLDSSRADSKHLVLYGIANLRK